MAFKDKLKFKLPKKADIYSSVDKYFGYMASVIVFLVVIIGLTQIIIPTWKTIRGVDVLKTKEKQEQLDESTAFLAELKTMRNVYDQVDYDNIKRIGRLLPKGFDKERIFLQLQTFGDDLGFSVSSINLLSNETKSNASRRQAATTVDTSTRVDEASISLTIQGIESYEDFKAFLGKVERYSPVLELTSIQYPSASLSIYTFTTYYLSE